jgi:NodT family efflux transporter outer membrane factor (OMF) lipoprotein
MLSGVFFGGCAGWRAVESPPSLPAPDTYLQLDSIAVSPQGLWWNEFGDETLDTLMIQAFESNFSFRQRLAQTEQVRQQYIAARASWFPLLSASGSFTESDYLGEGGFNISDLQSGKTPIFLPQTYSVSATAAWELDLFGKLHAGRQAAGADLTASREDLNAFALSLSSQLARSWYGVVALRAQKELLDRTIVTYQDNFNLVNRRYDRGVASSVDLYQAKQTLSGALSQRETVIINLSSAEHSLATLLGRYPDRENLPQAGELPEIPPPPPAGVPSELVQRRPDLRAAQARLVAADRRAAQAVANRFPSISLTGSLSGRGQDASSALDLDQMVWSAVTGLTVPIFEGGRRSANANAAEAAWKAQSAFYAQTVLNAFRDVEDALVRWRLQANVVRYLEEQVQAATMSANLAMERYLQGVTDYLPVTVQQGALFTAQRNLISARQGLIDAHIQLVLSTGGGWTEEMMQTTADFAGEQHEVSGE